jgi:hypothetical protein
MSTQPSVQEFPKVPGDEADRYEGEPGTKNDVKAREERIIKSTRVEFGIFVRKVVDGRVVRQWQFPPGGRRKDEAAVQGAELRAEPPEGRAAAPEPDFQAISAPLSSTGDGGDSGEKTTTTYEAGVFFRTESVSPPDWGDDDDPVVPPKDA